MIINELRFSRIQAKIFTQKEVQVLGANENQELYFQIEFQIGHSFDSTQKKALKRIEDQKGVSFQKQIHFLCQNQEENLKVQLVCFTKQFKVYSKQVSFKKFLQNSKKFLSFEQVQQQEKINLSYNFTLIQKNMAKGLTIINPKCQIMKNKIEKDSFVLQMSSINYTQRTLIYTNEFFWQESLRFLLNNQQNQVNIFLVDSKRRKTKVYQLNLQIFKRKRGSKKIMLFNENNFPMGCFQFDYQTEGFVDIEKEVSPQISIKDIFKIQIGKIKGKFKSPVSQVSSITVVSNISNIETDKIIVTDNSFQYNLGNQIYSEESRCIFIVSFLQHNVQTIGYGALDLMMLGKFEKRVPINHSQTKAILGHLLISIQAMKRPAKSLKITAICLKLENLEQKHKSMQVLLKASISCNFGKTQIKSISHLVNFLKGFQVKYSKEQMLYLRLIELKTNAKLQIQLKLKQLQANKSGRYEQKFGSQLDFARGTISFAYSYDQNEKICLDQKQKSDINAINKQGTLTKEISQQKVQVNTQYIGFENRQQQRENKDEGVIQSSKKQIAVQQKIQAVIKQEKNKPAVKITPKQALLQTSQASYKLENHLIQYIRPHKKMKSRKKKLPVSSVQKDPYLQASMTKKSSNKINSLKRYQYLKNIYLGIKNLSSSNTNSLHKISYSSKLSEFSSKKEKEVDKQPQLPKLTGQKSKLGQKTLFPLSHDYKTKIGGNKFKIN